MSSHKALRRYVGAVVLLMMIWAFFGFSMASRYFGLDMLGASITAAIFAIVILLIERQIILIFGKNKCFDTKKAERYFKERRIKYQYVDLLRYGLSGKEFDAVLRGVGGIDNLIDWESKSESITVMKFMEDARCKED